MLIHKLTSAFGQALSEERKRYCFVVDRVSMVDKHVMEFSDHVSEKDLFIFIFVQMPLIYFYLFKVAIIHISRMLDYSGRNFRDGFQFLKGNQKARSVKLDTDPYSIYLNTAITLKFILSGSRLLGHPSENIVPKISL